MSNALMYEPTLFDDAATAVLSGISRAARVPFDDSETEDIVLVRDAAHFSPSTDESAADCDVFEDAVSSQAAPAPAAPRSGSNRPPKRIGNGKLVASRVQWRPGDPFGQAARSPTRGFEWNRMVRSACVTAACGLLLVWLLHIA